MSRNITLLLLFIQLFHNVTKETVLQFVGHTQAGGRPTLGSPGTMWPPLCQIMSVIMKLRNTPAYGNRWCITLWNYIEFNVHKNIKIFICIVGFQFYLLSSCFDVIRHLPQMSNVLKSYFQDILLFRVNIKWRMVTGFRN